MAVRREKVVLEVEDRASRELLKVAAAAKTAEKALNDLDGTRFHTGKHIGDTSTQIDRLSVSAVRGSSTIDQFSGRLGVLARVAAAIGPAIVPIGALAVPAITGLAAQMGFAATGAVSMIVAFQGVGDALEAVNKAALEPTADNIRAAQTAMAAIGPDARRFVTELHGMGDEFKAVRDSAAAGLFPGLVDSLNELDTVLPRVGRIFEAVGEAAGGLAADATGWFNTGQGREFLTFIERNAPQALDQLGRTAGNVAIGLAELWQAFDPLNDDFSQVLLGASADFADWADNLSETEGFREFVAYVRTSGPQVAGALGAIGNAILQIVQAAAPLGGPTLAAIRALANAIAAIADSPIGTPLLAMASAMSAVNLASRGIKAGLAGLAISTVSVGKAATTAGAALKRFLPYAAAAALFEFARGVEDTASALQGLEDAMASGDKSGIRSYMEDVKDSQHELFTLEEALQRVTKNAPGILTFGLLGDSLGTVVDDMIHEANELKWAYEDALAGVKPADATMLSNPLREVGDAARDASVDVQALDDALASLSGWLDKREALRGYRDAIRELGKGLGDGFSRSDAENVDALGRGIIRVAESMTNPGLRQDFLADARAGLVKMRNDARGLERRELTALIRQLNVLDRTKAEGRADVDVNPAQRAIRQVERLIIRYGLTEAQATAAVRDLASGKIKSVQQLVNKYGLTKAEARALLDDFASGKLKHIIGLLNQADGFHAKSSQTHTITTIRQTLNRVGKAVAGGIPLAAGGQVRGPGGPRDDAILARLSNGEFVVNAAATARHLALLHEINAQRYADGGRVGAVPMRSVAASTRTIVERVALPERVTLEVDGERFTAYVRGHAADVASTVARDEADADRRWQQDNRRATR